MLERHFAELRGLWRVTSSARTPAEERIARSFEAWFAYVRIPPVRRPDALPRHGR